MFIYVSGGFFIRDDVTNAIALYQRVALMTRREGMNEILVTIITAPPSNSGTEKIPIFDT